MAKDKTHDLPVSGHSHTRPLNWFIWDKDTQKTVHNLIRGFNCFCVCLLQTKLHSLHFLALLYALYAAGGGHKHFGGGGGGGGGGGEACSADTGGGKTNRWVEI